MARNITLSAHMMALIRREAAIQRRSLAGQARHWIRIGRSVEETGVLDYRQIRELLHTFDDKDQVRDHADSDREGKGTRFPISSGREPPG
ncbi:TA system antitoxin ParD family protein [Thioclava sp. NG1]|uniref:TA system antitoxin ParD family protein n=1 Tax=Thioclava sp. NG1 TaxID=2182426 RepID=UPI001304E73A